MEYLEFKLYLHPHSDDFQDVLEVILAEIGFDSFIKEDKLLKAYIATQNYSKTKLEAALKNFPLPATIDYQVSKMENINWNEEWEKNSFEPLIINNECVVAAPYHRNLPPSQYKILLTPHMSFGTGHHETTRLMLESLLQQDIRHKDVLDMGCGTGILAIMARKRGANHVVAIDYDEWCVKNTKENIALNQVSSIDVKHGDAHILEQEGYFDIILANIHINIIVNDLPIYTKHLTPNGSLFISGFYEEDIEKLKESCTQLHLKINDIAILNGWCRVELVFQS